MQGEHSIHSTTITIARLLAMAIVTAAIVVGAVIGCAVSAQARPVAAVSAVSNPAPPTIDNWHQAWRHMTRDGQWCAELDWSGPPGPARGVYDCTTVQPPFPSLVRKVGFKTAMRLMAQGWGVTRPHRFHWLAAPQGSWF